MKRALVLAILLGVIVSATSCINVPKENFNLDSVKSYRDIPKVTEQEISAIEALKKKNKSFSYGHLTETEAFILPDGTYAGFTTKFCQLMSELFGISFVQKFYEWEDLKDGLDNKLIDFTGDLTPTSERMKIYFMTHPIAERSLRIFTHVDSEEIKFESNLNGLKIGHLRGSIDASHVMSSYPKLAFTVVDVDNFSDAAQMLKTGKIDVFITEAVVDPAFEQYDYIRSKEFFPLVFTPVSLTTANPDLEPIITVMNKYLEFGGIDKLYKFYKAGDEEYARYKLEKSFTAEEKAYLNNLAARGGTVKVALENENYPVCFYNKLEKEYQGISMDILQEISSLTGIKFETVTDENTTWAEIMEKLSKGEAAMVPQLLFTEPRKNAFLFSSTPYCSSYYALISKTNYPNLSNYQVLRARVGVLSETAYEDMFKKWFPDHANTLRYNTASEGFEALDNGEIDLFMASEYELLEEMNYHEKPGYKINILFSTPSESLFGFNKSEKTLRSIIDKSQTYVKTNTITNSWTSRGYDYSKKLSYERTYYLMVSIAVLLCVLILTILLFLKNKRLSKSLEIIVRERTHELELQTATLSTIYASIPDLVFCKDTNSVYTSCNPSFEKFAGHKEANLIGKTDAQIFKIDQKMAELFVEADKRVLVHQNIEVIEELVTYPDGRRRLLETLKTPLIQNGAVIGMMGIGRDITERKESEDAIEKRLEQQKLMADLSQNFISSGDVDSMITKALQMTGEFMNISRILILKYQDQRLNYLYEWCNDNAKSKLGLVLPVDDMEKYIADSFAQKTITHFTLDSADSADIIHRYNLDLTTFLMIPLYVDDKFWGVLEFDQCDRYVRWTLSDINLGELIAGVLSGVISRRQMENELVRLSAIVASSPQFIALISDDGKFEYFNPAVLTVTGYSKEELVEGGLKLLFDEETIQYILNEIPATIRENKKHTYEIPIIRKDGERRIMSVSSFTIENVENGSGAIAMDITEMRRLENDLIEAKEQAEMSSKAKGEFLSRMSHEMRTPMNAIIGMTNIAKNTKDHDKKEYCLDKIDNASKHLLGVINDILDMSKIEADKFELVYDEFNFEKMLMNITGVINFRAEEKKQNLIITLDNNIPYSIIGDELRLSQVITNLLTNAIKFTPEGGTVKLNANKTEESCDLCTLQIEVADNGIGISPEQQSRLFTSFEQADGGIARKYGGTGLGLAISKRIIEMMDGRIWIESKLGHGSRFIFTAKVQKGAAQAPSKLATAINRDNIHILAVDDSPEIRTYFLHVMNALDLPCDVAADAYEALSMIENRKDKPYNIFFVDWQMPGMDGIDLTRKIKEITADNSVVIMISVSEWKDIEASAASVGISRFISKPLFPSTIINCINECLGLTPKDKNAVQKTAAIGVHKFKNHVLLLAEDVEINREIIETLLDDTGLIIECAENGLAAFNLFQKNPDRYSMILMDIHMPEMDGYEATRKIRSLDCEQAGNIPIVAMTANVFKEDIESCRLAGMNDHIGKPVNTDKLFEKLHKYLPPKAYKPKDAQVCKPIERENKQETDSARQYAQFLPAIDVENGLRRVMNNKKLYFTLLKNFSGRQMADELIKNIKNGDFVKTAQTAHALKGVSANLALLELTRIASYIENQAKMETDSTQLIASLDEAVDTTVSAVNSLLESDG